MVQERKVVPLPILRGSSVADALSGFAPQIEQNERVGRRVEYAVTAIAVEIRGWPEIAEGIGADAAERLRAQVLDEITRAVESAGGSQVAVGGTQGSPVLTATFSCHRHATRALFAAHTARDIAARSLHPSMAARFHACIGVNSGTVTHTHVNGSGLEFRSMGTVRMFAARLQEFAGPDQIFVSDSTLRAVPVRLDVAPIGPVRTNGDGERQNAYCLLGFAAGAGAL
jgi:class 3 adenylate cyclase